MFSILGKLFDHLKAQAPTAEAYDALTLQLNTSFRKVFYKFSDLKESSLLAPVTCTSVARGGEGPSKSWKPASEFSLWDESSDDVQVFTGSQYASDDDDDESDE